MNHFIKELCQYIDQGISIINFNRTGANLYIGELPRDQIGIYVVDGPQPPPDKENAIETYVFDFYAVNPNTNEARTQLRTIHEFLHRRVAYDTGDYYVHVSLVTSPVQDLDRDIEGRKRLKLSVLFKCYTLIS